MVIYIDRQLDTSEYYGYNIQDRQMDGSLNSIKYYGNGNIEYRIDKRIHAFGDWASSQACNNALYIHVITECGGILSAYV